jgi:glycosyltransferase involved in cell wall biosynthesis
VRILYLADIRFPLERANGIQTFETCCALAERGHRITLAVRPDSNVPARDPFAFYGRAPVRGLELRVSARWPARVRRMAYLARAVRLASARERYDAVLTRDLGVCALLVTLPRQRRIPVVYESHGYAPAVANLMPRLLTGARARSRQKVARLAGREARVWRGADAYVTITAGLARELQERFGPRPRLGVVPDGVRLAADRQYQRPPPAQAPLIAYAGHLYPWKGVDVLLDALARVSLARGLIIGGHPGEADLARLQQRAAALGLLDRVTFTGMVPPADVAGLLAQAHVLVLPNTRTDLSERYTSPLKLFEYLAAGRAIVASDLPAIREVLTHGEDGWLVEAGNASALADGIANVIAHPELAADLSRRAWTRATAFTWASRAARLEDLLQRMAYAAACSAPPAAPPSGEIS